MASSVHERLLAAVTGNPGTGAVTVGAAVTGYQGLVAGDDTKAFDVVIYNVDANGNANGLWEVQAQAVYTNASTSLARVAGNVVDGSSGAGTLVNFSSGTQRVANVLSTSGTWIVRKVGGTAGTNEGQISCPGNLVLATPAGGGHISLWDGGLTNAAAVLTTDAGAGPIRIRLGIGLVNGSTETVGPDVGILRVAANVCRISGGDSGNGWCQITAGEAALAANFTNATATMANTNISLTVIAGRAYRIEGMLQVSNSTAGDGVQLDFNGGSATATTFFAAATAVGTVVSGTLSSTTLAGVINFTSITGTDYIAINGYILVNAGGTLILRAAENTHTTGTLTLGAGSWITLSDTVNL